jgi:phosphopantetheine adenylyltransferase/dephospho-CoA kinase
MYMTVIGLTGGIASGKSTAAALLKEYGAIVIDADRVGHRVYEPGTSGFQAVVNEFGHDLVAADGTINRQLLGGKVFGDPAQMQRLTDIVWPEIRKLAAEEIADLKKRDRKATIVLEAAVMIEAGWTDLADEVWVVTVSPEIARDRLMSRNGLTEAQAQSRIDSQLSNKERLAYADVKIDNSGTVEQFEQRVEKEWKRLQRRNEQPAKIARVSTRQPTKAAAKQAEAAKSAKQQTQRPKAGASKRQAGGR